MEPDIQSIVQALQASWSADTDYEATHFDPTNPARGQCVVSSLVVQGLLGGELIRYHVSGAGYHEKHYANLLPNGSVLDTTFRQYQGAPVTLKIDPPVLKGHASMRAKWLSDAETRERYELLMKSVRSRLER